MYGRAGRLEFGLVGGAQACNLRLQARFPSRAAQIGHRFPAEGFCRKSGLDFQPRVLEIGAQFPEKFGLTSRGADHACKGKGCQHHVVFM